MGSVFGVPLLNPPAPLLQAYVFEVMKNVSGLPIIIAAW